jgi:hypothetical protein
MRFLFADAIHVTPEFCLILGLAIVAGAAAVYFLRQVNQDEVNLKKDALEAGGFLGQIGLPHSAAFWNAIALGDFKTAVKELYVILAIFKSPEQRTTAVAKVVDTYITDVLKAGDTNEVQRLQTLLSGTWAQAAAAPLPTGQQLAQLVGLLNPQVIPPTPSGSRVVSLPSPLAVQPPGVVTTVSHAIADAATTAAAAASVAAPVAAALKAA